MDSVTQLQNYLASITTFMTQSLQHATHGAHQVTVEQVSQALKEERAQQQQRALEAAATAANKISTPALPTISENDPSSSATPSTSTAPPPIPDLAAPLYSGLQPSVEFAMSDRAHQLFKRVIEADVLLASLPSELGPEAQQRQLEQLAFLESYNEKIGQEVEEAQEEARLWQKRVSFVLQQAAACQLRTSTTQAETATTNHNNQTQTSNEQERR